MDKSSPDEIRFTVPGEPVGKGRARSATRKRRDSSGKLVSYIAHITPEKTEEYELKVKLAAKEAMNGYAAISGPVMLELKIYVGIAASWPKKKRELAISGAMYPTKKPDSSNILKAIEDAMNEVSYADDAQITDHHIKRRFSETPRVDVIITPLAKLSSN